MGAWKKHTVFCTHASHDELAFLRYVHAYRHRLGSLQQSSPLKTHAPAYGADRQGAKSTDYASGCVGSRCCLSLASTP